MLSRSAQMFQRTMCEEEGYIVRLRGLPWSASQEEVANFLEDCDIKGGEDGIHFTYVRDGRPSGEAYVEFENEEELQKALTKDKHHMGKRYIDVFRSKRSEMEWVVKRSGSTATDTVTESVIRLRGLPFGCSKEEIAHFFSGLEIIPNGITLLQDPQGRTTGDAFVQFASPDIAERALSKHKDRIGHRYIEIFKSSQLEVRNALNMMNRMMGMNRMGGSLSGGMGGPRPGPYDRGDRFSSGGMGGGGAYSNFRAGRGRGNIKGFFDDGFDDFGGGYGPTNRNMGGGGMGRRGGGGGMGGGGGGGSGMGRKGGGGMNMLSRGFENYESQTGHCVHMRGLPFAANEQDILDFFKPLDPVNVFIHYQPDGRASGEADVDFSTHDEAKEAMSRDRATMQHRYIELFLRSTPAGSCADESDDMGGSGFQGGRFGNMRSFDSKKLSRGGDGSGQVKNLMSLRLSVGQGSKCDQNNSNNQVKMEGISRDGYDSDQNYSSNIKGRREGGVKSQLVSFNELSSANIPKLEKACNFNLSTDPIDQITGDYYANYCKNESIKSENPMQSVEIKQEPGETSSSYSSTNSEYYNPSYGYGGALDQYNPLAAKTPQQYPGDGGDRIVGGNPATSNSFAGAGAWAGNGSNVNTSESDAPPR